MASWVGWYGGNGGGGGLMVIWMFGFGFDGLTCWAWLKNKINLKNKTCEKNQTSKSKK